MHDPQAWAGQILCSEPERRAFQRLLGLGLADSFRLFTQPEMTFSWWDYRMLGFRRTAACASTMCCFQLRWHDTVQPPALTAHRASASAPPITRRSGHKSTEAMTATVNRENVLNLYPALTGLTAEKLDALLQPAAAMALPAGTRVFAEHQPCQGFPLLLEGSIKVVKQAANGRELMLYRVTPGTSCIITSSCLLGHSDYNALGIAETQLHLLILPAPAFGQLMLEHAPFRDFVFHLFAERIGELMQLVEEVAFTRLDQRLARLILAHDKPVLNVTHQQLADELGSVREIVSRLLKGFAAQGLVALGREHINIIDRDGLQKFAAM